MNCVASDLLRFAFIDEKGGKAPGFRTRREKLGREDSMLGSPSAGPGEGKFSRLGFKRDRRLFRGVNYGFDSLSLGYGGLTRRRLRVAREMGHARTLSDQLLPGDPVAVTLPSPLAAPL